ncbi:perilipin-2-like isoform X2 [Epinephelus lanceolatus]
MPLNNNQKGPIAAARLAKLPIVHSACTKLSELYSDTKCSHPHLRSVCEVLESSVTAVVSPVIVKLEPQISIANDVACRSLDWLETSFPVIHTPTEQIVASAKDKIHEIRGVVSIAANGTVDCVERTVLWLTGGIPQTEAQADQSLLERAISVASVGLESALIVSESLIDRVLPPTEEDKEEEAHLVEGFEAATLRRRYPVRLVSFAIKLCRRTYNRMQSVQMYNLGCPPPQHQQLYQDRSCLNAAETSTHKDVVQVRPQHKPTFRVRRPTKTPAFDNGCNVKGCVSR